MGRKRLAKDLFVYMNGRRVGTLSRKASGLLQFSYFDGWLQWKNTRPISLSMPLSENIYEGIAVNNFFDNLLPDNVEIRKRIQARFGTETKEAFELLSYIGVDCVGALQFSTEPQHLDIYTIQASPIDEKAIAILLKCYRNAPLGMDRDSDFRISIAGAQEKTALLWYQNQWCRPKGVTPTSHIVKLPIGFIQHANIDLNESVENEWICLKILSAFGLPVNEASIIHFDDMKTLVVQRFDRLWSEKGDWLLRLPQEDMCQALGVSSGLKYESDGGPGIKPILDLLAGAFNANKDREQFMRSIFLFWLLGAIDGHAKNFSISLGVAGRYSLTPLYDVISAYPIAESKQLQWQKLKMAMSLKGKTRHYLWNGILLRHWYAMARYCQFPENLMKAIIDESLDNMEQVIEFIQNSLPDSFPEHISGPIFEGMRKCKEKII